MDKEEEWPEFIVKFQAFLAIKGCTEAIQTNFKSKWWMTSWMPVLKWEKQRN